MILLTKSDKTDIDLYTDRINYLGHVLFDPEALRIHTPYYENKMYTLRRLAEEELMGDSGSTYTTLDKVAVIRYLVDVKGVDPKSLKTKGTQGESLNSQFVLEPLAKRGYATEFLELYMDYTSQKTVTSRINKLPEKMSDSGEVDWQGRPLRRLHCTARIQDNLRFNYSNTDIISLSKPMTQFYHAGKDYYLVWGDAPQADFKIAFNLLIRDERNTDLMDSVEDSYLGMYLILCDFFQVTPDEEEFRANRELYKMLLLASIYGQSSGQTPKEAAIVRQMNDYLKTCPRYVEFRNRIEDRMDLGLPVIVDTYFGHRTHIDTDNTKNKSLNTPFQSGTSEIIIHLINWVLNKFYSLGYSQEQVHLYMTRHDEPVFRVHKEALKDFWVFKEASSIRVDDWGEIKFDYTVGKRYGVEDPINHELEIEFATYEPAFYPKSEEKTNYIPVPKTLVAYYSARDMGNGQVMCAIYGRDRELVYAVCPEVDYNPVKICRALCHKLVASVDETVRRAGMLVYSGEFQDEFYFPEFSCRLEVKSGNNFRAVVAVEYGISRYAEKNKVEVEFDESLVAANLSDLGGAKYIV